MPYATAKTMSANAIPVISLEGLHNGTDSQSVADALHQASRTLGFIYVKDHGIPEALINETREQAFQFFRLNDSDKQQVRVSQQHRGWLKPGAAKMADDAKADMKESFIWGYQDESGSTPTDHPLRGPNQWPAQVPTLEKTAMRYFHHAHDVANVLMRGFALGLKCPENTFLKSSDKPLSRASLVYYPAQPEECDEDQFGVAPHTDFGVLTVLCQDNTGGLQVQDIDGHWLHAPPIEGTLVVNVGDLLSRWTNGEYKSTPHRVVNTSGRERLSLVLAFDPNPDTLIDASEIVASSDTSATSNSEATTCGDYLLWRFEKAFAYRSNNHDG